VSCAFRRPRQSYRGIDLVSQVSAIRCKPSVAGRGETRRIRFNDRRGLSHLRLNHMHMCPLPRLCRRKSALQLPSSLWRACATAFALHRGEQIVLNVCENGFISINPPLTDMSLGSLSTRTSRVTNHVGSNCRRPSRPTARTAVTSCRCVISRECAVYCERASRWRALCLRCYTVVGLPFKRSGDVTVSGTQATQPMSVAAG